MRTFTAYVEFDPETELYIGTVPGVQGAHTQGATLDELQSNLQEVLELCIELSSEPYRIIWSNAMSMTQASQTVVVNDIGSLPGSVHEPEAELLSADEAIQDAQRLRVLFGADQLISAMSARIIHSFRPLRIILFGSHARGDASLGSDVDLLVVLPEIADKRKAAIEIRRALADFPVSKDVIVTTPEEIARRGDLIGPVLRPALREGKLLYEQH